VDVGFTRYFLFDNDGFLIEKVCFSWGDSHYIKGKHKDRPYDTTALQAHSEKVRGRKQIWIERFWYFLVKGNVNYKKNEMRYSCHVCVYIVKRPQMRRKKTNRRNIMKRIALILCIVLGSVASAFISFMFGSFLGLAIWFCVFAFIAIEVIYHLGAKGSLSRSFRSNTSSEVPDAHIEQSIQTARGRYDLDYRGRGRNQV